MPYSLLTAQLYDTQGDQPEKVKKSVTYPKAWGPGGHPGPLLGSRGNAPGKILRFSPYIIMIGNFSTTFDRQRLFLMLFIALSRLQRSLLVED